MKNKYKSDIDELLEYSLQSIKSLDSASKISKVQVKNILENFRSSLEYMAQYINTLLSEKKQKIYFPYASSKEEFSKSVKRNLPNLKNEDVRIYDLIESLQPYSCSDFWLIDLCNATNIAKHSKALEFEDRIDIEKKLTGISSAGVNIIGGSLNNANIIFTGNYVNGKKVDDFKLLNGKSTIISKGEIEAEFSFDISENKTIVIKDVQQDLLKFLYKCHSNIYDFSEKVFADQLQK